MNLLFNDKPIILGSRITQRVVFVGPFGVGKTTALRVLSDVPVVCTDEFSSEVAASRTDGKATTTVGIDYGEWHLPNGEPVGLIGVPGQERFDAVWDTLISTSAALVLWVYGNSAQSLAQTQKWLAMLAQRNSLKSFSLAVTRLPDPIQDTMLEPYRALVKPYHPWAPVLSADPRNKDDVIQAAVMALSEYSEHDAD